MKQDVVIQHISVVNTLQILVVGGIFAPWKEKEKIFQANVEKITKKIFFNLRWEKVLLNKRCLSCHRHRLPSFSFCVCLCLTAYLPPQTFSHIWSLNRPEDECFLRLITGLINESNSCKYGIFLVPPFASSMTQIWQNEIGWIVAKSAGFSSILTSWWWNSFGRSVCNTVAVVAVRLVHHRIYLVMCCV